MIIQVVAGGYAMGERLTPVEFNGIRNHLERISDTWADLWFLLNLTQVNITQLLRCRYQDLQGNMLVLPEPGTFAEKYIALPPTARIIIGQRRSRYPGDIFLFQSHSLRVKATDRPVTLIAFNTALKKAAQGVTPKMVSSKSALYIPSASALLAGASIASAPATTSGAVGSLNDQNDVPERYR
ncbi:hypothetical protein G9387_06465 [Enterobacter hormaechei]|uniref:hypothetical protein n=1 Tax=Enterobacter hormaechei TaxID=158836 RepID=UPI0015B38DCF|nr:hypothetical protein [Enterobacter hormaechei]KAF6706023.1 hypothetical protein G9393_07270 [Enterobacter hormaechei]KAF6712824.1 hypothetical protein G9387_06465 [Enterobacter hormaechei]